MPKKNMFKEEYNETGTDKRGSDPTKGYNC